MNKFYTGKAEIVFKKWFLLFFNPENKTIKFPVNHPNNPSLILINLMM